MIFSSLVWLAASAVPLAGQAEGPSTRRCWKPGAEVTCRSHWIAEVRGTLPLIVANADVHHTEADGTPATSSQFEAGLEWEIGHLFRVSDRWSLGPSVAVGTGAHPGVLRGVRLRGRRWGEYAPVLDIEGGLARSDLAGTRTSSAYGAYLGVRAFPHRYVGLGAHLEWFGPEAEARDDAGPLGIGIHAATSGIPGLITSGVIGVVAAVVAAVVGTGAS